MTNEAHEKGIEAARLAFGTADGEPIVDADSVQWVISAYLQASGQVVAPREPTNDMEVAGGLKCEKIMFEGDQEANGVIFHDMGLVYREMISAYPDPFQSTEDGQHD